MESQGARLEREAEETLWQLSGTLEELRDRMTPGAVVDQVIDYTRDNPGAEFLDAGRSDRDWYRMALGCEQLDFTRGIRRRGGYSCEESR